MATVYMVLVHTCSTALSIHNNPSVEACVHVCIIELVYQCTYMYMPCMYSYCFAAFHVLAIHMHLHVTIILLLIYRLQNKENGMNQAKKPGRGRAFRYIHM